MGQKSCPKKWGAEGLCFSRGVEEADGQEELVAVALLARFLEGRPAPPASGSECNLSLQLSRGETLVLVLLLSLGLWALIWGALSLFGNV
jgi:hypothetical protein